MKEQIRRDRCLFSGVDISTHHPVGFGPGVLDLAGDFGELRDEDFLVIKGGAQFDADDGAKSAKEEREPPPEVRTGIPDFAQ